MRQNGFVSKVGHNVVGTAISAVGKIYPHVYFKYAPRLTCSCCGKTFLYRGIEDADCVAGLTYDFDSGEWVASGGKAALCDDCQALCKGDS